MLGIDVRNPYTSTGSGMTVSSSPITHHKVRGQIAMDVNMPGTQDAGERVVLDVVPTGDAREVRAVVVEGGAPPWLACRSGDPNDGGWALRLRLDARAEVGEWTTVGDFTLLHLEDIPAELMRDAEVRPGALLGVATGRHGGACSTGPHLHCEISSPGHAHAKVDLHDPLSDASVIFSIAVGDEDSEPGPRPGQLEEAARLATSLSAYYQAMNRSLPSRAVRGEIYQILQLGEAAAYRGTIDQNVALLKALKSREAAPRSAAEL